MKEAVINKINKVKHLISGSEESTASNINAAEVPQWSDVERLVWKIGEEIRHQLVLESHLREDAEIRDEILSIVLNKNARKGRQPFVLLLGFRKNSDLAKKLITQLGGGDIDGHVINTLYKMRALEFKEEVKPFASSKYSWIRNEAKRYLLAAN
jgi:hypothetical protein